MTPARVALVAFLVAAVLTAAPIAAYLWSTP